MKATHKHYLEAIKNESKVEVKALHKTNAKEIIVNHLEKPNSSIAKK